MSKRNPTSELNHDNWNDDEEKEEAGHFRVANEDALKKREIRVAKRRTIGAEDKGTGGLFKGFTGFSGFTTNSNSSSNTNSSIGFAFGQQQSSSSLTSSSSPSSQSKDTNSQSKTSSSSNNANHLSQLKALNQSVLKWISQHVMESPYCVLTPIFRDYERHLASIEQKYPYVEDADTATTTTTTTDSSSNGQAAAPAAVGSSSTSASVSFNFSASAKPAAAAPASAITSGGPSPPKMNFAGNISNFTFNAKPIAADADKKTNASTVISSSNTNTTSGSTEANQQKAPMFGFSFSSANSNGSSSFPTGSTNPPVFSLLGSSGQAQQQQQQQEEEEYEPPKPETREIKEAGAVYTKRCKLFYMSPDTKQWCDKGVGNLHVKPTDTEGKAQLIIRADNTLGTILLNTLINKEMSLTVTKNNLNFACVPNPPLSGKSDEEPRIVPFLIKVKSQEDAIQLLSELDKLREKKS